MRVHTSREATNRPLSEFPDKAHSRKLSLHVPAVESCDLAHYTNGLPRLYLGYPTLPIGALQVNHLLGDVNSDEQSFRPTEGPPPLGAPEYHDK